VSSGESGEKKRIKGEVVTGRERERKERKEGKERKEEGKERKERKREIDLTLRSVRFFFVIEFV
jgi:hypothetical protein